jgi:hypothetical protein
MTAYRYRFVITVTLLALATAASAQDHKKLYCWNDNGHKVCGDALPPEAASQARTVINANNGMPTGQIARPPTPEERATAAVAAEQAQAVADARTAAERRDLAMVESYSTEDDLRRAYGERTALLDTGMKASGMGETNLRLSMVNLLNQASGLELSGKPVPQILVAKLQAQHADMVKQKRILGQQQRDRAALDSELADALTRYRTLKQAEAGGAVTTAPAPAVPVPPKN